MTQKRMFDRGIVSDDSFTEMPSDAQSLYFHLGIHADDEGFISPKGIMRMISASEDSLKVLVSKNFVIPFKSGVVVITNWKKNNWLDNRRIKETEYQEEKKLLALNKDKYTLLSNRLAVAPQMLGQSRVEESRVEENRIVIPSDVPSRDVVEVIDSFKEINPSHGRWYKNKTQRGAITRLLSIHGKDRLLKVIGFLPTSNTLPYVPTVTTPFILESKWADLQSSLIKLKNKSVVPSAKVAFT